MFVLSALVSMTTQSFRFGPEIAYVAALVLDVLKHERRQTLVGGSQEGDVWGLLRDGNPVTVIARTHVGLFGEMVLIADRSRSGAGIRIGFAGVRLHVYIYYLS